MGFYKSPNPSSDDAIRIYGYPTATIKLRKSIMVTTIVPEEIEFGKAELIHFLKAFQERNECHEYPHTLIVHTPNVEELSGFNEKTKRLDLNFFVSGRAYKIKRLGHRMTPKASLRRHPNKKNVPKKKRGKVWKR